MSHIIVTGAAGFVGSHLCRELLSQGHEVVGLDGFIPYYPRELKEQNLQPIAEHPRFVFRELDFRTDDLSSIFKGGDVVYHLAAQAGLLRSWSEFDSYMTCNVQATQRILEATVLEKDNLPHFINISTSSVYGRIATGPEDSPLVPVSPYGITKLAAEQLCWAYQVKDNLPVTVCRLFSVYGPGQRPDMGYNIFIRALLNDEPITIFGDGNDSRSNTFIDDCIRALILVMEQKETSLGETFNIGGGEEVTVNQVLELLTQLTGVTPRIKYGAKRPGDQKRTMANINKARQLLGYSPSTSIRKGLEAQLTWQKSAT